jgi:SAM-dependent methyltransferase
MLQAPSLHGLDAAALEVLGLAQRLDASRQPTNSEGGDVGGSGSRRSLVRHVANYLAAVRLADGDPSGPIVDVGAGVGTLTAWLTARLGDTGHLVDADPAVRRAAADAYPELEVHGDLADPPAGCAALVTAMEVIEHIPPDGQHAFVRGLLDLLRPGGLLVMSTPDESGYLGGRSGYAPHVGVLDADALRALLESESSAAAQVWRMEGEVFSLGRLGRFLQPVANRSWGAASALAPKLVDRLVHAAGSSLSRARRWHGEQPRLDVDTDVRLVAPDQGSGTGLLAALRLPR